MDYSDYLDQDSGFDDSNLDGFDIEEFLKKSQEQERKRLEADLKRIDQQLEERDSLHRDTVEKLQGKIDWYVDRLELLYTRSIGKHGRRTELKDRIAELYQELRQERQQHWQDKQKLLSEQRDLRRELDEVIDSWDIFDIL